MSSRKNQEQLLVGLDIGTSKVATIVALVDEAGDVDIIGIGTSECHGLKKGVVVDIESTVQSIQRSVQEAELMAGCEISSVSVGVAGTHISSMNSHGIVGIKDKEVTKSDIDRVIEAAGAVAIPADQRILHIIPQEYLIDDHDGIQQPLGMSGVRLEAKVHIVTCADSAIQNVTKCIVRCGLEVDSIVLQQLASGYAVLSKDEKDLGVCMVDIGAGTTDISIYTGGAIRHTAIVPIAGDQVTNDIAVAIRTPTQSAEDIKIRFGCAISQMIGTDESFDVTSVSERKAMKMSRQTLAEVVQPRYEELLSLVMNEIRRSGFEECIPAGVVLTGGASRMEGVPELAEEIFHAPVRLGVPKNVSGLQDVVKNPIYAATVGLIQAGLSTYGDYKGQSDKKRWWKKLGRIFLGEVN
ncbi:MAG: cell division protein FtsA [Gammaproteobacteria bacterium]|nr:cell division protein FtsA [Gammaproteobacteria bacterium]